MKKYIFIITLLFLATWLSCSEDRRYEDNLLPEEEIQPDDNIERVHNPYWAWAQDFPGAVQDTVERLQNITIEVDGNYETWSELLINTAPTSPFFSTGLYAAPAEIITVEVPEGVTGLQYRIGVYHCVLSDTTTRKRYSNIVARGNLQSGTNKIYNYFGGHLYMVWSRPTEQKATVKISGAVKSPDFILGETTVEEWKEIINSTGVPWGELRGKRMILTMPVSDLQKVPNPEELLQFYDEFVEKDYNEYIGTYPDEEKIHRAPSLPWRFNVDKQLCAGSGHNGYPFVGGLDWAEGALSLSILQDSEWGTYHELGHNYQTNCWKWSCLGEVTCNLHVYHLMNRKFNKWPPRDINFESAVDSYVLGNNPDLDPAWDFESMVDDQVFFGLTPFLQIAQEFGWRFFAYLAREGRETGTFPTDQQRKDFFACKCTEYANLNLIPFFEAWRITLTDEAKEYMEKYPTIDTQNYFWEKFDREKIPNFEFRTPVKL